MKLLKMGSNKSENGEDATQKLKNVINNLVNSEDADKRTPVQKAVEKSDIGNYKSPKNIETIHTTKCWLLSKIKLILIPYRSSKIFNKNWSKRKCQVQ